MKTIYVVCEQCQAKPAHELPVGSRIATVWLGKNAYQQVHTPDCQVGLPQLNANPDVERARREYRAVMIERTRAILDGCDPGELPPVPLMPGQEVKTAGDREW